MPRNALGRGLGALIREPEPPQNPTSPAPQPGSQSQSAVMAASPVATGAGSAAATAPALSPAPTPVVTGGPLQIDIDLIEPSPYQPRTRFRDEALDELARSIQASGIIQPIVVRAIGQRFQLIAGERRWRAAQRAGLNKVSAIVRQVPDELALEMTLVENIQREDLNAMEQARAFERLMDEFQSTQEAVAERTGKDRTTVANAIRLLKLEPTIQDWIEEGKLTAGHGRALLAVADPALRMRYAQRAARGGLTVRQIERLAARRARGARAAATAEIHEDPNIRQAVEELQRHLGTKVILRQKTRMRPGQLILEYYDDNQLMGLYDRLAK
jgi:ParB family transcriptional regulator, chromosome partitioning protein